METNVSTGFNTSFTDSTTMDDVSKKYQHAIMMTVISMIFIEATVHIYKKNKNDLEPIYIFELNTLVREPFIEFKSEKGDGCFSSPEFTIF